MELDQDLDNAAWNIQFIRNHRRIRSKPSSPYKSQVLVKWKNGESSWMDLSTIKGENPFSLIKYAVKHKLWKLNDWEWINSYLLDDQKWWEAYNPHRLLQQARSAPHFKFGIEVPKSVKHALYLDRMNGDHAWEEAIRKEIRQIHSRFSTMTSNWIIHTSGSLIMSFLT